MKSFSFCVAVIVSLTAMGCMAGLPLASEGQMKYEYVEMFDGLTKEQIFDNALRWIAQNFNSSKAVVDFQDKINGTIVAKGGLPGAFSSGLYSGTINFTLTLDAKDGKARFRYTQVHSINYEGNEATAFTGTIKLHEAARPKLEILTRDIKQGILKPDTTF